MRGERWKQKISESLKRSNACPEAEIRHIIRSYRNCGATETKANNLLLTLNEMIFRSNSKYRQYHIINEAKENFLKVRDSFAAAPFERQEKFLDSYVDFARLSIYRIKKKDEEIDVYQKNKLFLYPDIEMAFYYLFSVRNLVKLQKVPSVVADHMELQELTSTLNHVLNDLKLVLYSRALLFEVP